jgi:hypothetical protein
MLRPWLQLVRIPAVFSSLSNAFAGWWIGGAVTGGLPPLPSLILALIAAGLYLTAGMALNDIADVKADRAERPSRPLASGAVSISGAWALVIGFFAAGLLCQWIANPASAQVGLLLIAAIFLYNFVLKGTVLGPLNMGLCRVLNLAGGMALAFPSLGTFASLPAEAPGALGALVSLGFYIMLVTFLARDEVQGNSILRVRCFFAGLAAWFAAWAAFASLDPSWRSLAVVAVLFLHAWLLRNPIVGLRRMPASPATTGKTVGGMLGTMPATDVLGMLAVGAAWPWAPLVAMGGLLWMLPGRWLARRFYTT